MAILVGCGPASPGAMPRLWGTAADAATPTDMPERSVRARDPVEPVPDQTPYGLGALHLRVVPGGIEHRCRHPGVVGSTVALSVGVPAGTLLAGAAGWRVAFGLMSVIALALVGWIAVSVPAVPGRDEHDRLPLRKVLRIPGVPAVLGVTAAFVLAHNLLYTYVSALLEPLNLEGRTDTVLLVLGLSSLASILATGALIDRRLRTLTLAACGLLAFASTVLAAALLTSASWPVCGAAAVWGFGFGGAATLPQTAVADAAGTAADLAQSLLVTCWNLGIAAAAFAGGLFLDHPARTRCQGQPWRCWSSP